MSLALATSFVSKQNSVLPLAQSSAKNGIAIRVASAASDTLGVLTATSPASPTVSWTLLQNPSWVTLSVDSTTLIATLVFSNAAAQPTPYQFLVSASDGVTTVYFPVFLEVRDPLTIATSNGATSFSIASYDSTVPDIVFQGLGLGGAVQTGVQFVTPSVLPPGMKFITGDGSTMRLRVAEPSSTNVSGGLALFNGSPVSMQIALEAYLPGSMYDSPNRCVTQNITIESLTAKTATLDLAVSLFYDATLSAFSLASHLDFLGGQSIPVTYEWDVTGTATGNISSGGTASDTTLVWIPATAGNVGFTVKVKSAATGVILGETIIAPVLNSSGAGIPCSPVSAWNATNGVKLSLASGFARGFTGGQPTITVSTPASELNTGESITVHFAVSTPSTLEGVATLTSTTAVLTANNPVAVVSLTLPESGFNQKWTVTATAANAANNPTRTGYAQAVVLSNGDPVLTLGATGGPVFTSNVGVALEPIALNALNPQAVSVGGVAFALSGAPAGLSVDSSGRLQGNALIPGTYTFEIVGTLAGYARSYSSPITLTASAYIQPLAISDAIPSVASLPDGQQFTVSWGYSGSPVSLDLIQGFTVRSVLGINQISTSEVGSSVFTVYGTDFFGGAYSIPALVLSSSTVALGDLPDAPTIGTIDEAFNLTLQWNPLTIDGGYQAYKNWNIRLSQPPNGVPQLQTIAGNLPTGLEPSGATAASRLYETVLVAGDWTVTMQALTANPALAANALGWDNPHEFPTSIASGSVTFDNPTVSLGQTLTLTLDPNYIGADTWQAIYPDGSTSGWMPISSKVLAKVMNIAGDQSITIQTQRDYSKSNPPVKLLRQITKPIYVMNQQYIAATSSNVLTGDLGIGGESGFEITDASLGAVALTPYETIVRALVRDTVTNELKVMIATSRTANASSLLGTMAIDVFPIQSRPRTLDLVSPALYLSFAESTAGNPVRIATASLPNIIVGKPMSDFPMQVGANSGVAPFSWYADNLPFGITLSTNGTLSGTAMTIGTSSCDFSVVDSNTPPFIAHATLQVVVESDLAITTTALPQAIVGTPYSFAIQSTGGIPPYSWSLVAGALPLGLSIDPGTGNIVGTPVTYNSTTDFSTTYTFTVEIVDAIGAIASVVLSCTLAPATLQFGVLDQPVIFAGEDFELTLPVFGGTSPYTLSGFKDDGTIGTGLTITNTGSIPVLSGMAQTPLSLVTGDTQIFPASYPIDIPTVLSATGGVPPYKFTVLSSTIPSAGTTQSLLIGEFSADGVYSSRIQVNDSLGNIASKTINVTSQQKTGGPVTIQPVSVNLNGSNNPANWTVTPLASLPDAKNNAAYNGGSGTYYGLAVYLNNQLHMTQISGPTPMSFSIRSGSLPNGIIAFSGNVFNNTTDYSGIVLFNVSGGQNATSNGSYSFEAEFSNIVTSTGAVTQAVTRNSITVTTAGGGSTPVVVITTPASFNVDLSVANPAPLPWTLPLNAEGGVGPYTFNLLGGTTLPAVGLYPLNSGTVIFTTTTQVGNYVVVVSATSSNGITSAPLTIAINLMDTPHEPVSIVASKMPTYLYANRPIPADTYFVEANLAATWGASGLPTGVSFTTSSSNIAFLQGTPSSTGNFTPIVTALSASSSQTATTSLSFEVRPETAAFVNFPASVLVWTSYRAATNNAVIQVAYVGYQPGDANLPLPVSQKGTVGAPGIFSASGVPTTSVSNLTADGFTMSFDYIDSQFGNDVLTLGAGLQVLSLPVVYPVLTASGTTVTATVSEYSKSATFAPPVTASGGLAPYTVALTGFSDSRFTAQSGQAVVSVGTLPAGQTTGCQVSMLVTDSSGSSASATGTLQVTVRQETYIDVNFSNAAWAAPVSTGSPFVHSLVPSLLQSVPVLGHAPYQFYVDSVTLPPALIGFVQVSPSKRVLAINSSAVAASASIFDVDQTLANSGSFIVAAVNPSAAPAAGTYIIQLALRVVDNDALTASANVTVTLTIT